MRTTVLLRGLLVLALVFFFAVGAPRVQAAGLTFSASTTVSLTGTGDNLTIAGGSTASSTVVNTGNIVIAMQNGDSMTVSVTNKSLTPTGMSTSAVVTRNTICYTNTGNQQAIVTLTATQNESVTLAPVACSDYATGGTRAAISAPSAISTAPATTATTETASSTVGTPPETETTTPATSEVLPPLPASPTVADIQTVLNAALGKLSEISNKLNSPDAPKILEEIKAALQSILQSGAIPGATPLASSFTATLSQGSQGENVEALQSFLKSEGTDIYPKGLVTGYFGPLTREAVGRFQLKYGILISENDPGYGYVGPKTREKINSLLGL